MKGEGLGAQEHLEGDMPVEKRRRIINTSTSEGLTTQLYPLPLEYPLESLRALMERLRHKNHYPQSRWYEAFMPPPHHVLGNLRRRVHYETLSQLMGLSIPMLRDMTLHRFVPFYYSAEELARLESQKREDDLDGYLWDKGGYVRYAYGSRHDRVCPLCWQEWPTIMLPWELRHVTTCPVHKVLLVERCGGCGKRLRLDIIKGECMDCGAHVSTFPVLSIKDHEASIQLTALMYRIIGLADWAARHGLSMDILSLPVEHPLHHIAPAHLLLFFRRFAQLLPAHDPQNPLLDPLSPLVKAAWPAWGNGMRFGQTKGVQAMDTGRLHVIMAATCQLLVDWPDSWHSMLERMEKAQAGPQRAHFTFPHILMAQFSDPAWGWLNRGCIEYIDEKSLRQRTVPQTWLLYYRTVKQRDGGHTRFMTLLEVAKRLQSTPIKVKQHAKQGLLEIVEARSGWSWESNKHDEPSDGHIDEKSDSEENRGRPKQLTTLVVDESVRRFEDSRNALLKVADVSSQYGISRLHLLSFVKAGLLKAEVTPIANASRCKWLFSEEAVHTFFNRVLEGAVYSARPEVANKNSVLILNLRGALRCLGNYTPGLRLVDICKALMSGKLRAFRSQDELNMKELWFYASDVRQYARIMQEGHVRPKQPRRSGGRRALSSLLTQSEVRQRLNCGVERLRQLSDDGILVPGSGTACGTKCARFYRLQDVEAFLECYIRMEQAADMLGCSKESLRKHLSRGHLPAACLPLKIGGRYYFSRAAFSERLRDTIGIEEAAKIFGVGLDTMYGWTRDSIVPRVQWFDVKRYWYSRAALTHQRASWLTTSEVIQVLGASPSAVMRWVHSGRLVPVAMHSTDRYYWFARSDIERWQSERLSAEEAALILGVKPDTLLRKVKTNKLDLTPVDKGPMKRVWFAKADVMRVKMGAIP